MVFKDVSEQLNFHAKDVWGSKGLSKAQLKTKKLIVCRFRVCFGFGMFQVPADKYKKIRFLVKFYVQANKYIVSRPEWQLQKFDIWESKELEWMETPNTNNGIFERSTRKSDFRVWYFWYVLVSVMFYVPADNSQWDLQKIRKKTVIFEKFRFFLLRFRYLWIFFYGFRLLFQLRSLNKPESKRIKKKYFS